MTKRIIALFLALILTVGLLPTVALAAEETGTVEEPTQTVQTTPSVEHEAADDPIHIKKSVSKGEDGKDYLTMEAYVTNPLEIKQEAVPLDIVLVLDVSGSMDKTFDDIQVEAFENYGRQTTNSEYKKYALENQGVYYDKDGTKTRVSVTSEDIYDEVSTLTYYNVYYNYNRNYYAKDANGQYHRLGISRRWVDGHYAYYLTVDGTEMGEGISWTELNSQIQLNGYTFHQYRTTRYTYKDIADNTTILTSDGANNTPRLNGRTATFYYSTQQTKNQTRLDALKAAAKQFIANVAEQELPEGKTHRISIVKFSGNEAITIGNDFYSEEGYKWNWTQTVVGLTNVTGNSVETLKNKVGDLQAAGGTLANNGMSRAKAVLDARKPEEKARPSVVIMFTDGVPTSGTQFEDAVAAGAINNAKNLKDSGTTVYTIAVDKDANPEDMSKNINWYLNAVSSNYPDASATKTGGGKNEKWTFNYDTRVSAEKDYYFTATDAQGLSMVFDTISREVSNLALVVDSTAVLSDTLSGFFTFDGVDAATKTGITVKEVPVNGTLDASGNVTWNTAGANDITSDVEIAVSGKSITVKGFDYGEKAVTKHQNGKVEGSKLVITFPIKPDDTATWEEETHAYPTNDTNPTADSLAGLKDYALKSDPNTKNQNTLLTQSPTLPIEAHKVTYVVKANGYTGYTTPEEKVYRTGAEYIIDAPLTPAAGSGYTFTGWCTNDNYTTTVSGTEIMGIADVTLYGKFSQNTYQVDLSNYIKKTLFADSLPEGYNETFMATVVVDGNASGELTTPAFTANDFTDGAKNATKQFKAYTVNLSAGTHTFTVTETAGTNTHITYDTAPKTFALQVAANGDVTYGTMENGDFVEETTEYKYVNIENRYTPDTVSLDLTGKFKKVLNSQDDISGLKTEQKTFTLTIKDSKNTTVATGTAAVAEVNTPVAFIFNTSYLTFNAPGDYTYAVQESNDGVSGMSYATEVTLTVTVADKNGKLEISSAKVTGSGIEETSVLGSNESFTVINTYTKPSVTVEKKTVTARVNDHDEIQNKLDEAGIRYPEYVSRKNKCELTVDKNIDSVTLAYEVTINGEAGAQANVSDPNASYIGGTADEGVTVATDGKTVTFTQRGIAKLYYTMKFDRNTEGTFDNAMNTVIVNDIPAKSEETTITDVDPTGFDFSDVIQKELTVTGSKPFTGATFEATLTLTDFEELAARPTALFAATAGVEESHEEAWGKGTYYKLYATYDSSDKDGGWKDFLTSDGKHLILDFPADGIYTFRLEETNKTLAGVTYDDDVYTIKVYVSGNGSLAVKEITVVYEYDGEKISDWIFRKTDSTTSTKSIAFHNTIDTGKDDYIPIIIPTIINKDTGMLNKTDHFAYVIGYPDGTVHPNGQITRAEVATIFFRLLKDEVRDGAFTTSNSYSDVAYGKWYNNPISTMSALGIITGYPDGTFKPDKPITRAEFAAIAARFDETQYGKSATFSDVIGHWAANEIGIAYANEWIKGYPDGTFKPDQNITRAEAMTMINRVLERKPESPSDLLTDMNKWTDNMDTSKWYYLDVQEATNSHAYTRKTFNYELWRQMLTDPDWSRYER